MSERRRNRGKRRGRSAPASEPPARSEPEVSGLTRWTAIYGGAGLGTAALGFVLLSQGSIALAPTLLVVAFLVFFPLALVK